MLDLQHLNRKQGFNATNIHVEVEELPSTFNIEDNEQLDEVNKDYQNIKDGLEKLENYDISNIKFIGEATKEKLIEEGYDNIFLMKEMRVEELINISGLSEDKCQNIINDVVELNRRYESLSDVLDDKVDEYNTLLNEILDNDSSMDILRNLHVRFSWNEETYSYEVVDASICEYMDECPIQKEDYPDLFEVIALSLPDLVGKFVTITKSLLSTLLER